MSEAGPRDLSAELAQAASELLTLASASESRAMHRLVELAARHVPGCSGATAGLWKDDEPAISSASHPDLSELADVQLAEGRGPAIEARTTGRQVSCPDTLSEDRWPEFTSRALSMGVRSSLTLVHRAGHVGLTLTMYSTRPGVLDASRAPVAELLIAFGSAVMRNTSSYDAAQRTARQLSEGADSRAVVDQAKGILMVGLSCSADEALRRMREISQTSQIKVTEVARRIVESHELDVR
ncbi:MAG TPA: ANTAR domain-containing protein [Streptosporangiaceae bacterium]|nr:ANTAR domain-containing protein [Streptosporangiaceae bacterium]